MDGLVRVGGSADFLAALDRVHDNMTAGVGLTTTRMALDNDSCFLTPQWLGLQCTAFGAGVGLVHILAQRRTSTKLGW